MALVLNYLYTSQDRPSPHHSEGLYLFHQTLMTRNLELGLGLGLAELQVLQVLQAQD